MTAVLNQYNISPKTVAEWFRTDLDYHIKNGIISTEQGNHLFTEILNSVECQKYFLQDKAVRNNRDCFNAFELVHDGCLLVYIVNRYKILSDCEEAKLIDTYEMNGFFVHIIGAYNKHDEQICTNEKGEVDMVDRHDTWDYGIVIDLTPII